MKTSVFLLIAMASLSSCNASQQSTVVEPAAVLAYFDGTPRAHLPVVFWFSGNAVPLVAKDARYDDYLAKSRLEKAPKFGLAPSGFRDLVQLLRENSGGQQSSYVVELLFADKTPEIVYVKAELFGQLREKIRAKAIRGQEILFDWPLTPPQS